VTLEPRLRFSQSRYHTQKPRECSPPKLEEPEPLQRRQLTEDREDGARTLGFGQGSSQLALAPAQESAQYALAAVAAPADAPLSSFPRGPGEATCPTGPLSSRDPADAGQETVLQVLSSRRLLMPTWVAAVLQMLSSRRLPSSRAAGPRPARRTPTIGENRRSVA